MIDTLERITRNKKVWNSLVNSINRCSMLVVSWKKEYRRVIVIIAIEGDLVVFVDFPFRETFCFC